MGSPFGAFPVRRICGALASLVFFPRHAGFVPGCWTQARACPFCRECVALLTQTLPERSAHGAAVRSFRAPWPQRVAAKCHLCRLGAYDFDFVRSFGAYSPSMARAILLLKYGEITPWVAGLRASSRRCGHTRGRLCGRPRWYQYPLHASALRERGYNQAELIAGPSRGFSVSHFGYLLVRTRPRPEK